MLSEIGNRPGIKMRLDWRAYFLAFKAAHGGCPINFKGRLLFEDGWRYSATDYQGPEWPPPEDERERRNLLRAYWLIRRGADRRELEGIVGLIAESKEFQRHKSLPLQQRVEWLDRDDGQARMRSEVQDLDLSPFEARARELEADLERCEQELKQLEGVTT